MDEDCIAFGFLLFYYDTSRPKVGVLVGIAMCFPNCQVEGKMKPKNTDHGASLPMFPPIPPSKRVPSKKDCTIEVRNWMSSLFFYFIAFSFPCRVFTILGLIHPPRSVPLLDRGGPVMNDPPQINATLDSRWKIRPCTHTAESP